MAETILTWGLLDGAPWPADDWPTQVGAATGWDVQEGRGRIFIPGGAVAAGRAASPFGGVGAMAVTVPVSVEALTAQDDNTFGQFWLRIWLLAEWDGENTPTDGYCIEAAWNAGTLSGEPIVGVGAVRLRRRVSGVDTTISTGGQVDPGNPPPAVNTPVGPDDPPIVFHLAVDAARTIQWGGWKQGEPVRIFQTIDDAEGGAPEVGAFLIEAFTVASAGAALEADVRLGTIVYDDLLDGVAPQPGPPPEEPLPPIVYPAPEKQPPPVSYDLVAVDRIPRLSGPPTFVEVDSIPFGGLAWGQELNRPDDLQVGVEPTRLSEAVRMRLRSPAEWPLEVWLYRNGAVVAAGPVIGYQVQGPTLTLQCRGRLYYTRGMILAANRAYKNVDQHLIAKALIDYWQGYAYGHFGIDTSKVQPSGRLRERTYLAADLNTVYHLLELLCDVDGGPDMHVDPATGEFQLWTPARGSDRTGVDGVFIDSRNIANPNVNVSLTPEDLAAQTFATTTTDDGTRYIRAKFNATLAASWGRIAYGESFYDVETPEVLQAHADGLQAARSKVLFEPDGELIPVPDADVDDFEVGDTIDHTFDYGLGTVSGGYRVTRKQIVVDDDGTEKINVGFA